MEITEKNKLIAEFMGLTLQNKEYSIADSNLQWMAISANSFRGEPQSEHFDFNSSWDWLMPVVEKIEQIKGVTVIIESHLSCKIFYFGKLITKDEGTTKKDVVYNSVIQAIQHLKSLTTLPTNH